jgi:hypothetical protein
LFPVNTPINLNHQSQFNAIEIDDELVDQVLPSELDS